MGVVSSRQTGNSAFRGLAVSVLHGGAVRLSGAPGMAVWWDLAGESCVVQIVATCRSTRLGRKERRRRVRPKTSCGQNRAPEIPRSWPLSPEAKLTGERRLYNPAESANPVAVNAGELCPPETCILMQVKSCWFSPWGLYDVPS